MKAGSKSANTSPRIDLSEWEQKSISSLAGPDIQDKLLKELRSNWGFVADINQALRAQGKGPILEFYCRNNEYIIESFQYAAQIRLGDLVVSIEPRSLISSGWLPKMIQCIFNINFLAHNVGGVASTNSILELYYVAFLRVLETALSRGVFREYILREDNLPFLKERLLVNEQIKRNRVNRHMIYSEFSELSSDNLINQTLYYALSLLERNAVMAKNSTRRKLVFQYFCDDVSIGRISLDQIRNIQFNRRNIAFREPIRYCENIIRNIGGDFKRGGENKLSAFYVDMNDLFEAFVGNGLKRALRNEDLSVSLQEDDFLDDRKIFGIRPDILIKTNDGHVRMVADTKYKRLRHSEYHNFGIDQADIYQILAYARRFRTSEAILIYPKPPENIRLENDYRIGEVNVRIRQVNLQSDTEDADATSIINGIFSVDDLASGVEI